MRSNTCAVRHPDEFVAANSRAAGRFHLFPADSAMRRILLIMGGRFLECNFIHSPAVRAFEGGRRSESSAAMATIGVPSFADRSTLNSTGRPEPAIYPVARACHRASPSNRPPAVRPEMPVCGFPPAPDAIPRPRCAIARTHRAYPLKRQDLIALNMLDLSMPVPDAASARVNDVVVLMYSVPLLNQ
jgi:hypothetical protein